MLLGHWAVPLPNPGVRRTFPLDERLPSATLVLDVLPGEVHVERLAADLIESGRLPRWIRLAPYDVDQPALDTLAAAVADRSAGTGHPRRVVVESDDRELADRFLARLAAAEPAPPAVILHFAEATRERHRSLPANGSAGAVLERLTWGRPALYDQLLMAGWRLRPGELGAVVERSRSLGDLNTRVAARLLRDLPPRATALTAFAALLGYCHPRLGSLAPVLESCPDLPWWTELTGGWWRFDPVWRGAVRAACRGGPREQLPLLGPLVADLLEDAAVDAATELCLDAGYPGTASDLIQEIGPDLLSAGRPLAVRRWLDRLPWGIGRRHRTLAAGVRSACQAGREASGGREAAGGRGRYRRPRADGRPLAGPVRSPGRPAPKGADHPTPAGAPAASPGIHPEPALAPPDGGPAPSLPDTDPAPFPPDGGPVPAHPRSGARVAPHTLYACLLGPVEIALDGHRVTQWRGRKGTLLLAYLLLHRDRPIPRDVLAAAFWPEATPEAARNRMHVTVHTLRADLHAAGDVPVVVFDHGYLLNPDLDIRLDVEAFEDGAARGRAAEEHGNVEAALAAYRRAAREYRGDLLGDHPYDGWTLLPRERYRIHVLDVLGRVAELAFDTHRYTEAVETAGRLLAVDFCREDVHRLLMRAYTRLGWQHLALHQFETCTRQLRRELDIAPALETVELYHRIRARTPV